MTTGAGGPTLAGRYRLRERLGSGGMGVVWAATDEVLGREVAVKEVVPPPELDAPQRRLLAERTLREARAAARLSSRSAVTVYDVVEADGRPWIVMERLDATTLADRLRTKGPLEPAAAARLGRDLADALAAAHAAGVLHRDVKPANVLLPAADRAVLTDFGIAYLEGDPTLTASGMLVGSPAYMAPERARGIPAGPASDVWSLGATLYAAVEGRPPFDRDGQLPTLHAVVSEPVEPPIRAGALAPLLLTMLSKDPAERPSAEQVRARLGGHLDPSPSGTADLPTPAEQPDVEERTQAVVIDRADVGRSVPAEAQADRSVLDDWRVSRSPSRPTPARTILPAVAALALLVAIAVGGWLLATSAPDDRRQAGSAPSAGATGGESSPVNSPNSPSPETSADGPRPTSGSTQTAGEVPEGFRLHRDPTGFAVGIPVGWDERREGSQVDFVDPQTGGFLRIGQTSDPQPDPAADWRAQEDSVAARLPGYERVRIAPVSYRGWEAADWEFTWQGDGGQIHVLNRGFITGPEQAYAIYWSMPEESWTLSLDQLEVVMDTFHPDR